jgi:hypothetical protein
MQTIGARARLLALAAALTLFTGASARAQDSNYWTYQWGTAANLLGGAVIGSVVDISATYYNPGALPLIEQAEIIVTSKVFDLASLKVEPDFGTQVDLDNLRLSIAPGFVGGRLPFKFLGSDVLGYSLFTRQRFKATIDAGAVGTLDEVNDTLPTDDFLGLVRFEEDLTDYWVGLTFSKLLGSKVGLGVTLYGAYRSQRFGGQSQAQTFTDTTQAIVLNQTYSSYWNFRMLLKAGVTFEFHGVSFGLTVTSRSLSLFGSGRVLVNRTRFGISDPAFGATFQDGLGATFRSPLSLGLGTAYSPDQNTTVHFATEYYAPVSQYVVMDLEPFDNQSGGETITADLEDARKGVLNAGIGVEHTFSPTLSGYASFRTDFTGSDPDTPSDITFTRWNLYFITAGTSFQIGTADLTLGLAYGWGSRDDSIVTRDEGDRDPGTPRITSAQYRTLRFIIAFAI